MAKLKSKKKISRRKFLQGTGAALAVATAAPGVGAQNAATDAIPRTAIRVTVNGTQRRIEVEDRWTLVELLRDQPNPARLPGQHGRQELAGRRV